MPIDQTDPDFIAARDAAVQAALAPVRTETAAKLAELAQARDAEKARADGLVVELTTTKATADKALADYNAAKAAGESTAAELATLKAAADVAAKAADKALIESLPEPVRKLAPAGLAGADLAEWVADAKAAVSQAPTALGGGTGGVDLPTDADMNWAKANGYDKASPAKIIEASARFGPRADAAKREARSKQIATA